MRGIRSDVIGKGLYVIDNGVENQTLVDTNAALGNQSVELIGAKRPSHMTGMKTIVWFS